MDTPLWAIGVTVLSSLFTAVGSLFMKLAANKIKNIKTFLLNYKLYAAILFYIIATVFSLAALWGGDLSIIYPLLALAYIWIALLSMKYLNESMNKWKWAGIISILIGVLLIAI